MGVSFFLWVLHFLDKIELELQNSTVYIRSQNYVWKIEHFKSNIFITIGKVSFWVQILLLLLDSVVFQYSCPRPHGSRIPISNLVASFQIHSQLFYNWKREFIFLINFVSSLQSVSVFSSHHSSQSIWVCGVVSWQTGGPFCFAAGISARCLAQIMSFINSKDFNSLCLLQLCKIWVSLL